MIELRILGLMLDVTDKRTEKKAEEHRQPGRYCPVPSFANGDEELEWLFFQQEEKKRMLSAKQKASLLVYPSKGWGGATPQAELSHEFPEAEKHSSWEKRHRNQQISLQRSINEKVAKEKADRLAHDFVKEKRKAEESLESVRKRRKMIDQTRDAVAAQEAEEAHALYRAKVYRELTTQVELQYLSDEMGVADAERHAPHMVFQASRRNGKEKVIEGRGATERHSQYRDQQDAEEDARDEADRKNREDAAKRLAKQQADKEARDAADRKRKEEAPKRAHDRAREHAEQQEAEKYLTPQDAAFDQTIQGQLQALSAQYYATPEGPAKSLAARAYLNRLTAPMSLKETNSYKDWLETLEIDDMAVVTKSSKDTRLTIKNGGSGPVKPTNWKLNPPVTTTVKPFPAKVKRPPPAPVTAKTPPPPPPQLPKFFKTPPPVQTRAPGQPILYLRPEPQSSLLSPLKSPFPSTIDQQLAHAFAEGDILEPDVQRAIEESLKTLRSEAEKSLQVRAASMKITPDEWAQSQNYANAAAYVEAQVSGAKHDTEASPDPSQKPPTPGQTRDVYLEYHTAQMKKAIKEGIENKALRRGFKNGEAFAVDKGYENLEAWVTRKVERMKITVNVIPSRQHVSDMVDFERLIEDYVWREWQDKLVKAANWEDRIAALPSAPEFSPVQTETTGKLKGMKWAPV